MPRRTSQCDAVAIVREHLDAFCERAEARGSPLPAFVLDELRAFVICGDLRHGFVRVACRHCGDELRVPFACKSRGVCPSCMGRVMSDTAARWTDELLPRCGYRHWVLSFSGPLAIRLGYDIALLQRVTRCFARRVMQLLRRRTKAHHGVSSVADLHPGMITVVHRAKTDLGLFVHLHCLVTDGVFVLPTTSCDHGAAAVRWLAAPPLTNDDLVHVLAALHDDLGNGDDDDEPDIDPSLLACVQLSLAAPVPSIFDATSPTPTPTPLSLSAFGMSLHADTFVDGRDRRRLERLCRYLLRPPFAHDAVTALPDGRVRVAFKRPDRRGVTHADMPVERFLARLCALVPPPRAHRVGYFGVFSNHHRLRRLVMPARDTPDAVVPRQMSLFDSVLARPMTSGACSSHSERRRPLSWSKLLARVFLIDVTVCARCSGPMRILEVVTDPDAIAKHLHGARAPPRPSPPDQLALLPT